MRLDPADDTAILPELHAILFDSVHVNTPTHPYWELVEFKNMYLHYEIIDINVSQEDIYINNKVILTCIISNAQVVPRYSLNASLIILNDCTGADII